MIYFLIIPLFLYVLVTRLSFLKSFTILYITSLYILALILIYEDRGIRLHLYFCVYAKANDRDIQLYSTCDRFVLMIMSMYTIYVST